MSSYILYGVRRRTERSENMDEKEVGMELDEGVEPTEEEIKAAEQEVQ